METKISEMYRLTQYQCIKEINTKNTAECLKAVICPCYPVQKRFIHLLSTTIKL